MIELTETVKQPNCRGNLQERNEKDVLPDITFVRLKSLQQHRIENEKKLIRKKTLNTDTIPNN